VLIYVSSIAEQHSVEQISAQQALDDGAGLAKIHLAGILAL
jgi:hypothetical protein